MKKAIYAGSFDPLTNGHIWMIEQALDLFDEVVVAIGVNPDKKSFFDIEERMWILEEELGNKDRITVTKFTSKYLVNYAKEEKAQYMIRGIRNPQDFQYENIIKEVNYRIDPDIKTVFLMPPKNLAEVSSSVVKGLIGPDGWKHIIRKYVPPIVYQQILEKYE